MILNFGDIVKNIIEESKRVSDLKGIASFSYLADDKIQEVIAMDPTYKGGEYAGKYAVYLLDNFIKGNLRGVRPEDVTKALEYFNSNRSTLQSKRISDYDINAWIQISKQSEQQQGKSSTGPWPSPREMMNRTPSSRYLEVESPNPDYRVFYPLTWEASRKIAGDTKWCTASSSPILFQKYFLNEGGVFIFVGGDGHAKYQYSPREEYGEWELKDANNEDAEELYDELEIDSLDMESACSFGSNYLEFALTEEKNKIQDRINNKDFRVVASFASADNDDDIYALIKGNIGVVLYQGRYAALNAEKMKLLSKFEYYDVISINFGYVSLTRDEYADDFEYGDLYTVDGAYSSTYSDDDVYETELYAIINAVKDDYCTLEDATKGLVVGVIGDYVAFKLAYRCCSIVNRNTLEPSMLDVEIDGGNETVGPLFWDCCVQNVGFGGTEGRAFKFSYCNGYNGDYKIYTDGENVLKVIPPKKNDWGTLVF